MAAQNRAPLFQRKNPPSSTATIRPKRLRLEAHTQSEPPRVPVNSYHCASRMLRAKALPSTSQGQDISAETRYQRSHAIQAAARKTYGRTPPRRFLEKRKSPNTSDIWRELARIANTAPPNVALATQKVVAAFHSTKVL